MIRPTVPRRGSVDVDDPGYVPLWDRPVSIWLDGIEQRDVITYDIDEGLVVRLARDGEGRLILNAKGDEVQRLALHGKVQVAEMPVVVGDRHQKDQTR